MLFRSTEAMSLGFFNGQSIKFTELLIDNCFVILLVKRKVVNLLTRRLVDIALNNGVMLELYTLRHRHA